MLKGPGLYSDIGKKARGEFLFLIFPFCWFIYLAQFLFNFLFMYLNACIAYAAVFGDSDLLYKDYQSDHKFSITTYTVNGVVSFRESFLFF